MRRKDREITIPEEMVEIIANCDVCRIAFADNNIPYIVPVNFGYEWIDGKLTIYAHGANAGKKLDIISRNQQVCFEMDRGHRLIEDEKPCEYTMEYESVIGNGQISLIADPEEKIRALTKLLQNYADKDFSLQPEHVKKIAVLKITANEFTGKKLVKKTY